MAPTPVLLPGESQGWRSLEGCSPRGCWGLDTTERPHFQFSLSCMGEGNGNPLRCSCLENPRDGRAWWAAVYGVTQSRTRLKQLSSSSSSSFSGEGNGNPLQYSCLENRMDGGACGLQSMGSLRVRHDWATSLSLFVFMHWRRKWQPTPVLLPGESQGRRSLLGCRLWSRTELDTTEVT